MTSAANEQREKRAILENDRALREEQKRQNTLFERAQNEIGSELGGRYRHLSKTTVVGVPIYPQQPPHSPWAKDPTGDEPPLGVDVNRIEPVGTPAEIQASIRAEELGAAAAPNPEVGFPSGAVERAGPPTLRRRV